MNQNFTALSTTIAFWTRKLSLSVLLMGCLCSPSWGQVKEAEITSTTIDEDRVTVRIKVKGEEERPITGLLDTNFRLQVDSEEVNFNDWKSPEETTPPPAWIIILLDMSGSMAQPDSRGTTKLEGAISAIQEFTEVLEDRAGNTQIALVPFGEPGPSCEGYPVKKENLDKFFLAGDFKLQNYLDYLAGLTPCASTNLYEPLNRAVRFLADEDDPRFYVPEEGDAPQPRLSVILLSDGFHTAANEQKDFQTLQRLLERNQGIMVHTLGYGLTPAQLGQKYNLGRPATRQDLGKAVPFEEFVDQARLAEIAQFTGGVAEFSSDAQTIAESLKLFLDALLGEYEIIYTQPNPERSRKYEVQAIIDSPDGAVVESSPKPYRYTGFGRSLPLAVRLTMVVSILLLLGLGGVVPFWFWGKRLKQEALED